VGLRLSFGVGPLRASVPLTSRKRRRSRRKTYHGTATFADGSKYTCHHNHRTEQAAVACAQKYRRDQAAGKAVPPLTKQPRRPAAAHPRKGWVLLAIGVCVAVAVAIGHAESKPPPSSNSGLVVKQSSAPSPSPSSPSPTPAQQPPRHRHHHHPAVVAVPAASLTPAPTSAPAPAQTSSAWCTASADYNSEYQDYDVYVNSNEPNQTVTARASNGESQSYYTNSNGYADVYLHADPGDSITVQVGGATCSTTAG
jgi:hypothetical protein